ncbi:glycosyltransferase family 39 protein [Butyrivibrio sp. YAB3001]|uniref:glycosyltransferase family 39 protein n=1 Tax=Butyrivibrio sp. YAB3001 TaxID=1520812 RepID=UPI0008F6605E|nr:glycosyltransferase family 39 protein [Butyrivibrio sp. YAB3001]SFB87004.1 Dolichyl-phosphate-mannose-protein mannosyltransferase [Butyrivibrio sp. YAB3001]
MKLIRKNFYITCIVASLVILSICSKSSFLYPINNWGDASCYYVIGKGILHGLVPFKDYAEQKGPVIFFLYSMGLLINENSFIGIFILEIICASIFLYFSIKTISLFFYGSRYEVIIAFGLSAIVYSSRLMRHGGGPEELSLCIMSYAIYLGAKYFICKKIPDHLEMLMLGVCAGLLFWTKYTLCAFYIGILAFMFINSVRNKELKIFVIRIALFIAGCILISIPILLYFAFNNALPNLYEWYFYNNIFNYTTNEKYDVGIVGKLLIADRIQRDYHNILANILLVIGGGWLLKKKHFSILCMFLFTYLFSFFVFNASVPHLYSNLPLLAFCSFGFLPIVDILQKKSFKDNHIQKGIYIISCVGIAYIFCIHTYDLLKPKDTIPQYIFAKEMSDISGDDYNMLYYGKLDPGFYFASKQIPKYKAFDSLNIGGDELKNMQKQYITSKNPDYIITTYFILCDSKDYDSVLENNRDAYENDNEIIVAFNDFGYELIDEMHFYFEERDFIARLYKKIK